MGKSNSKHSDGQTTYNVSVKTCDAYAEGGTDSTVQFEFVGESGNSTGWLTLDNFMVDDFERAQVNQFKLRAPNVGLPMLLRIQLQHSGDTDEWLCDRIVVKHNGERVEFPIYDWIEDKIEAVPGKATLPQKTTNKFLQGQRRQEIIQQRSAFAWAPRSGKNQLGWGLPRFLNAFTPEDLPKIFNLDEIRQDTRNDNRFGAKVNALVQTFKAYLSPIDELSDYHRLYKKLDTQKASEANPLDGWDTDEGMGRITLNGIAPISFQRCQGIPEGFSVTSDDVAQFLREGQTLEDEIKAGKVYISDTRPALEGVSRNKTDTGEQIYCPTSLCLFYVKPNGKFVPIAIQLVPGDRDYLFTPAASAEDWLLAKMYYRCAIENIHQWIYHFLYTHGVMETIGIAVFRDLPRCHPVYKLLRTHLRNVAAINTDARKVLLAPDGAANKALAVSASECARKIYKDFDIHDLCIPKCLRKLGLVDRDLLPNYYYRDDALELWDIMEKYVAGVINHYYTNNEDIVEDFELQGWMEDVVKNGYGWQDGNGKGVPEKIISREHLIEICTTIIFTSTAQHAAVNFGQFETYKFIPSSPGGMRMPAHKLGEATSQRILDSLPDNKLSQAYIVFSYVLSAYSPNDVFIGNFPERQFTEEAIIKVQATFKADLAAFGERIKARNETLDFPYTYLLPDRIPNYIAI